MATPQKKTTKSKSKAKSKKPVAKKIEKVTETTEIITIPDVIIQETLIEPIEETPKINKTEKMVELLSRESGVTLEELAEATGWLTNSVRGALSAYAKKHPEYSLISERWQGIRTYRLSLNWHD